MPLGKEWSRSPHRALSGHGGQGRALQAGMQSLHLAPFRVKENGDCLEPLVFPGSLNVCSDAHSFSAVQCSYLHLKRPNTHLLCAGSLARHGGLQGSMVRGLWCAGCCPDTLAWAGWLLNSAAAGCAAARQGPLHTAQPPPH